MWVLFEDYIGNHRIVYNTETKDIRLVLKGDINVLMDFGFLPPNFYSREYYYKEGVSYYGLSGGNAFSTALHSYDKRFKQKPSTGDFLTDILTSIYTGISQKDLEEKVTNSMRMLCGLPEETQKALDRIRVSVPTNAELTWEELKQYEGPLGAYLLKGKLRTRRLYGVTPEEDGVFDVLNREFEEGSYRVEGNTVIFTDGKQTSLEELANSVESSNAYSLEAYRSALLLTGTDTTKTPSFVRLEKSVPITCSPTPNYTVTHNNAYIRVEMQEDMQGYLYRLCEKKGRPIYLNGDTMTLLTQASDSSINLPQKRKRTIVSIYNMWQDICVVKHPTLSTPLVYVGLSHIELTEKGYDIRVLCYVNRNNVSANVARIFYSIPLICSGLLAKKINDGYILDLALQKVTLSKTIYENLVCVGNGSIVSPKIL